MASSRTEIDISLFQPLLKEALSAYRIDASYAVAMSKQAVTVKHKRKVWAARLELRRAEKEARAQCISSTARACGVTSPCGTGSCPFANESLRSLVVPVAEGKTSRPIPSHTPNYNIESAVKPLMASRALQGARAG